MLLLRGGKHDAFRGTQGLRIMTWSIARILETLEMRNVMRAIKGRPCPVSQMVVARIQAAQQSQI